MLAPFKRIFGRARSVASAETPALPPSVEHVIQGLAAVPRAGADADGNPRVMLMIAGGTPSAWHHTPADTRRRLAEWFPDLNDRQLDRACSAVDGVVRVANAGKPASNARGSWASWKSARTPIFSE